MAGSPPRRKPRFEADEEAPPPRDRLSSLPLEVLDKILSRLHIYDVVRTSALSRAWRRQWESLPTLDLTRSRGVAADEVDALLLRRSAPVRIFRLAVYHDTWYIDALHDWILYLSRNGVESLLLWFQSPDVRIHSSLFSCRQLTSLDLTSCRIPPAPQGFAGFPTLKILVLDDVAFPEHGGRELASLIGTSPLIEEVKLLQVELTGDNPEDDEWVIRAPNLRKLTIGGYFPYGGRMEHLPSLHSSVINGRNYAKFLMGMAQVTDLQFGTNIIWATEVDVLDRLPFLFNNLRFLTVSVDFTKMAPMLSFFCLLRSAPILEELDVAGLSDCDGTQEFNADHDFLNAQWAESMFARLRVVRMKKIVCICNEIHLMEFILSKARVLRMLSIRFAPDALCIDKAAIAIKGYPRASPDTQVIFLGTDSANIISIYTPTENVEVDKTQPTRSRHDSIDTTENAKVEEPRAVSSGLGSFDTLTENAGVDETQATCSRYETNDMSPENAEVEGTQAPGTRQDSMETSTENADVAYAQIAGSRCGSINTFTGNAVVDKTQKTSSGNDSMETSSENGEVEEAHTAGHGLGSVSNTENAKVDETQTSRELVYDVRPLRRKRLDLEAVAQLEQLKVDKLELQSQVEMVLDHKTQELEERRQEQVSFIRDTMRSSLRMLSELTGVTFPPLPELSLAMSSLLAKSEVGDTSVAPRPNPGVGGAVDDHAVSLEHS